jgi:hypothetical protein
MTCIYDANRAQRGAVNRSNATAVAASTTAADSGVDPSSTDHQQGDSTIACPILACHTFDTKYCYLIAVLLLATLMLQLTRSHHQCYSQKIK